VELLQVLEDKVAVLIKLINELKTENTRLNQENMQISAKLQFLESSIQNQEKRNSELNLEKELTKDAVDGLIKTIGSLVENQSQ
jgi:hypothetical protein